MKKEIGSNFWLNPTEIYSESEVNVKPEIFNCSGTDFIWLSNCRSAISVVIETIESRNPDIKKHVFLPAFTCRTVYEPFYKKGYEITTIPVQPNLRYDESSLINLISNKKPGVLLIHNYFGFNSFTKISELKELLNSLNIILIEDLTQVLYSTFDRLPADYFVGSIRKWCGVPDGGIALCKDGSIIEHPHSSDSLLEAMMIEASILKYNYIEKGIGNKDYYLEKYKIGKDMIGTQSKYYSISPISLTIQKNLDIKHLRQQRRINYLTLQKGLKDISDIKILYEICPDVCPLYFPFISFHRADLQKYLSNNNIYAPIIWPKGENCPVVNDGANFLYENLLCIPVDQRYDEEDMERVVKVVKNFYNL